MGIAATAALNALIDEMAAISEGRPPKASPVTIALPESDDQDQNGEDGALGPALGPAEGQSFIIEYRDGRGQASTRRITVVALREAADGSPALYAKCRERNAMRLFRADRIMCCIDYDGEVFSDVNAFLIEMFGAERFDKAPLKPALDRNGLTPRKRWNRIRKYIAPHATLLAALSAADGVRKRTETEAAGESCLKALALHPDRLQPEPEDIGQLAKFIRRLEPDRAAITGALDEIRDRGPKAVTCLLRGAVAVMDADGKRHAKELDLINQVAIELTGMPIA